MSVKFYSCGKNMRARFRGIRNTNTLLQTNHNFHHSKAIQLVPVRIKLQSIPQPLVESIKRHRPKLCTAAASNDIDVSALFDNLELPDIDGDLASIQSSQGAIFDPKYEVPSTFGNNSRAFDALNNNGVVLVDRSHFGRLRFSGDDRLSFLHGQSTADISSLTQGTGTETAFVTPQARNIDIATVLCQSSGVMLITSPETKDILKDKLDKVIFPRDDVVITDISSKTVMFSILGDKCDQVLRRIKVDQIIGKPYGTHAVFGLNNKPVIAIAGAGLKYGCGEGTASVDGYTFIADESIGGDVWQALSIDDGDDNDTSGGESERKTAASGGGDDNDEEVLRVIPMGMDVWEIARVIAGKPMPGHELTEEYTPLEAGLYHAVSLNKGCYIGQETLAKVHGQDAGRRQLWGVIMDAPCAVGDDMYAVEKSKKSGGLGAWREEFDKSKPIGKVTSYADTPGMQHRALAYLRCRFGGERVDLQGRRVMASGGVEGTVVALSYATRTFSEENAPMASGGAKKNVSESNGEDAKSINARREAKLAELQAKLLVWQQQQEE